ALLLIGGVPLCFVIQEGFKKSSLQKSAIFILSALFAIMPATVRNYVVGGEFVPITSGGGEIFYMSYYEGCDGTYIPPDFVYTANPLAEHEEFRQEAIRRTGRQMSRKESSDYWTEEGMNYIKEDPKRLLVLLYKKFVVFWNYYEIPDNQNFYFMKVLTNVMNFTLAFGTVAPLGILGVLVSLKHWRRLMPVYTFFLVYMVSVLIVFNISRYRVPALPVLIVFSAFFIEWFLKSLNEKKLSKTLFAGAGFLFLFLLVNVNIGGKDPYKSGFPTEYTKLGKSYMLENDVDGGKRSYGKLVEIAPEAFEGHFGLGRIAIKERDYDKAVMHLENAVRAAPGYSQGYFALAVAYRKTGRHKEAQKAMKFGYMNKR
ncbi:MAG: tetratricopeptide repeat protein, partial [Nitrospinota bacterium]